MTTSPKLRGGRIIAAASLASVLVLAGFLPSTMSQAFASGYTPPADSTDPIAIEYSGRAIAVLVETGLLDVKLGDTGPLPPSGGSLDGTVVKVNTAVVKADILASTTSGIDNVAQSHAATANVNILSGTVRADLVEAKSTAVCDDAFGTSKLVNLKVSGANVKVTGDPNQTVKLPLGLGTVYINEQVKSEVNGKQEITVNALRVALATGGQVVISSAYSDILCAEPPVKEKIDHIDGNGAIRVEKDDKSDKATFDFSVGFKPGKTELGGDFYYYDPLNKFKIESTDIVEYHIVDEKTRLFAGFAKVNDMTGIWFAVWATDGGEPGKGVDHLKVILPQPETDFYSAEGFLVSGEITLYVSG